VKMPHSTVRHFPFPQSMAPGYRLQTANVQTPLHRAAFGLVILSCSFKSDKSAFKFRGRLSVSSSFFERPSNISESECAFRIIGSEVTRNGGINRNCRTDHSCY